MASFNKIIIVGYLGRDPEIRYTPSGEAVCNFSVATTERRKDVTGEFQDLTTWFKITVWRRQAEIANEYLSKGKQVYVEGRLRQTEYTDRDGNRRTALEVTASDIQFLGAKGEGGDERSQTETAAPSQTKTGNAGANKAAARAALKAQAPPSLGDDEIPF
ncbi:MAG: single-stranded DNA-binding protein [Acidobacteria bacterium]|nr:single-stranded DNA-binding protein [Acidobacteriota bacterium]MBI3428016.1 single-stranded DNA-binding protein [Acidobacteriota bacterium]